MQEPYFTKTYMMRSQEYLEAALDNVTAYREWRRFDPGRNSHIDNRYALLPLLTKQHIRDHFPHGLVPGNKNICDGLLRGEIEFVDTSGTTAEKVTNIWNQSWWDASETASWKLNAHTSHLTHTSREALLASALSVGFLSEADLPYHSRILDERFLFLNEKATPLEWKNYHYERMAAELLEFRPSSLEANPSLLANLCWWAVDNNISLFAPQVIVLTYELPSELHLNIIRQVFKTPVVSSYGSTEAGYVFMQCECGTFHQNTEFCRVDFMPFSTVQGGPSLGSIAVTTFQNPWTSLIRFDIGDLVRLSDAATCSCGRKEGFMLSSIEGRSRDATMTPSGRIVTTRQVDATLSALQGIRDYELRQHTTKCYAVKLAAQEHSLQLISLCREALRSLYGKDATFEIDFVEQVAPTVSGKYRRTSADFTIEIKDFLA